MKRSTGRFISSEPFALHGYKDVLSQYESCRYRTESADPARVQSVTHEPYLPRRTLHRPERRPVAADAVGSCADHDRGHRRSLRAVDSILAIFGITRDSFIVYTSNVCAILGLRSLYFLLAGVVHKFVYLKPALAIILSFIGAKMLLADIYHVPTAASLGVVGVVLSAAIGLSLIVNRQRPATAEPTRESDHHSPPVTNLR